MFNAEELLKRTKAIGPGGVKSTLDDEPDYTRAFKSEDECFVLWNMLNTNTHPRTLQPAVRLLGVFCDESSAVYHAHGLSDRSCTVRLGTTHEWYAIMESDSVDVATTSRDKVNRNLEHHGRIRAQRQLEFTRRRNKDRSTYVPPVNLLERNSETVEVEKAEEPRTHIESSVECGEPGVETETTFVAQSLEDVTLGLNWEPDGETKVSSRVSLADEVRHQKFAVISVLIDYETENVAFPVGKEPAVIVWATFPTEEEGVKYSKAVASKHVEAHDLIVVSMYEWLYPHCFLSKKLKSLYRNNVLNDIMRSDEVVQKKKKELEMQNKIIREIDVCPAGTECDVTENLIKCDGVVDGGDEDGGVGVVESKTQT